MCVGHVTVSLHCIARVGQARHLMRSQHHIVSICNSHYVDSEHLMTLGTPGSLMVAGAVDTSCGCYM